MNGSISSSVSAPADNSVARIDASCRVLLVPIVAGLFWLFVAALFALITSVKLHSPTVFADCPWMVYGKTRSVANTLFAYGFASQAGLAVVLWILCRLGRTALIGAVPIAIATLFWNLGVLMGTIGIFSGYTTGFEWLEYPNAGSMLLMASYLVFGTCGFLIFRARKEAETYPSEWFILGALLWFPWLFTTARLLLVWFPVRGVTQVVISAWFASGLLTLWLGGLGLAVLFYFIPKLSGNPLFSRSLALISFWSLAVFGGWAGLYRGLPLPTWMVNAGIAASVILILPALSTVMNLWLTQGNTKVPLLGFFKGSLIVFVLATVFGAFAAMVPQLRLTLFGEGNEQLFLYGFVALALIGAIHYIAPKLTGIECTRFVKASGGLVALGILVYAVAYLAGGIAQQKKLVNADVPFLQIMNGTKMFIRLSTLGWLLVLIGSGAALARVASLLREWCRACCTACNKDVKKSVKLKPAGAAR